MLFTEDRFLWTRGNIKTADVNFYDNDVFYCIKDAVLGFKMQDHKKTFIGDEKTGDTFGYHYFEILGMC